MSPTLPPRLRATLGACLASLALVPAPAAGQPRFPAVTIPETEVRTVHSRATGHDYDVYVYRPARIAADTTGRKYPVLYLLDAQWDFKLLTSIHGGLYFDGYVPDVLIVGITRSGAGERFGWRAVDYAPVPAPDVPGSGNADRFLAFLKDELMPLVEREYPADPRRRGLMGNSLGGLFAIHAMLAEPTLFAGYVAGSPAVKYGGRALFAEEAAYAKAHRALPARLFVMVGSDEPLAAPVRAFVDTLRARDYEGLVLESRVVLEERHSGNKPEGLNRGLRFLFRDTTAAARPTSPVAIGDVERLDPALDRLVPRDARIEVLADGFQWAEGPVWKDGALLFSDVPGNVIHRWKEGEGVSVFLRPSGYAGPNPPGREHGSNGLTLDARGALVMADHSNRQVAQLDETRFKKTTLADRYEGKRLNSPNDLVYRANGDLYFTDPPFGLARLDDDPAKELAHNGVYRLTPDGALTLVARDLGFPNGIAFSPDGRTLYVSNADAKRPIWMAYDVAADGSLARGRVLFDASAQVHEGRPGVPDGLKVDREGNLFAAGPGGVYVLSPEGRHLGTIRTGQPTANVAFGEDGRTLFVTANHQLLRVRLTTTGAGF